MSSQKKEYKNLYKTPLLKKCACTTMNATDATSKGAIPKDMPSYPGKMLCVGHDLGPLKKIKIVKPTFRPLNGWMSYREALILQEKKLRDMMHERIHFKSLSKRYDAALTSRLDLPKLDARGVRRYRFPCTVFIPLELEEDGYTLSASIIRGFIHYNENMKLLAVKGSPFYEDPPLSEKPDILEKISCGLIKVEEAGKKEPPDQALQIDSLLELAFHFLTHGETMAWIVEKVLLVAIDLACEYSQDGLKREALSRFAYGCFLRNFKLYDHAIQELETARNLSLGKTWQIEFEYDTMYDLLEQECSDVLCRVLLVMARNVRSKSPYQAVRYCSRALRRLGDVALVGLESEALLEIGLGYKEAANYLLAEQAFLEYLHRYGNSSNATGICTAYLEGALCYSRLGNVEKAQEFLFYVLEAAGKAGLDELTAVAQRYIGESFLKMGFFKEASRCLVDSFKMNIKLKKQKESDELRILASISMGMEIMPKLDDLFNAIIDDKSGFYLYQLLRWRAHRTPFWDTTISDAPTLPDESLYTYFKDEHDTFLFAGTQRMSLNEAKKVIDDTLKVRKSREERYLGNQEVKKEEQVDQFVSLYKDVVPSYEPDERKHRPELYTIAGGVRAYAKDEKVPEPENTIIDAKKEKSHKKSSSSSSSSSTSISEESFEHSEDEHSKAYNSRKTSSSDKNVDNDIPLTSDSK